ncbi:MAG: glycosyltransferase [Planctomycetota bacterium]
MTPQVTVVMPTYNAEAYLELAVRSVLDQTFRDLELWVYDDGSTDSTLSLLQAISEQDPRLRITGGQHRGYLAWLNEGLREVRSPYYARMDADDICLRRRLESQVAFLDAHPDVVMVGTQVERMDDRGRPLMRSALPTTHAGLEAALLQGNCTVCHPSVVLRREAAERVGGYREAFYRTEDLDLWLRLAEVGQLANLEEVLLRYRVHGRSVTSQHGSDQRSKARQAVREACERRGLDPEPRLAMLEGSNPLRGTHAGIALEALRGGYRGTALRHALRGVVHGPRVASAKVLPAAVFGKWLGVLLRRWRRRLLGEKAGPEDAAR